MNVIAPVGSIASLSDVSLGGGTLLSPGSVHGEDKPLSALSELIMSDGQEA